MFKIHLKNDSKPVINDYVLILNVPMQDASGVEEVHSRHHLPEMLKHNGNFPGIALIIALLWSLKGTESKKPENEARQGLVHDRIAVNELKQVHVSMFLHHHLISSVKGDTVASIPERNWGSGRHPRLSQYLKQESTCILCVLLWSKSYQGDLNWRAGKPRMVFSPPSPHQPTHPQQPKEICRIKTTNLSKDENLQNSPWQQWWIL